MIYVDLIIRSACLVLLMLLATNLLRNDLNKLQNRLLLLACLSVGCLVVGLAPVEVSVAKPFFYIVRLLDVPHLVLIWLFGLSLFRPGFSIERRHVAIGLVYCLPILWVRLAQFGLLDEISFAAVLLANLFTLLLVGHLLYSVIAGRKDDLSEARRRARVHFVFLISFMAFVISVSEIVVISLDQNTAVISTIKTVALFPAILWTCLWLLRFDAAAFDFESQCHKVEQWSLNEKQLQQRLEIELDINHSYLEPGLTIAELAQRVSVSESRLRAFIHQRLGYENFSAYINRYRIESVKRQFDNPEFHDRSILSIALDNGFASLSPFNRAFIKFVGITPTEYRKTLKNSSI